MANDYKTALVAELEHRFGKPARLPGSQSLLELPDGTRVYLRYSKLHGKGVAFFGLRRVDLNTLEGHHSYLCFFADREPPLFIPYSDFEAVISQSPLASDGQYKVQIKYSSSTRELYLPKVGTFNVDAYGGFDALPADSTSDANALAANLSHSQAQTLLAGIGRLKGYSVYVPPNNVELLDWTLVRPFQPVAVLPADVATLARFAAEIDVVWVDDRQHAIAAAFEVEHSTTIYSGLLRFNDVLISAGGGGRFFVVANESRRDLFVRQLQRPTFQRSGLSEIASFLDYKNVFDWYQRLAND